MQGRNKAKHLGFALEGGMLCIPVTEVAERCAAASCSAIANRDVVLLEKTKHPPSSCTRTQPHPLLPSSRNSGSLVDV
jgi:hypothetical protein